MIPSWLKSVVRRFGFDVVRHSDDAVLQELLETYRHLRLAPNDTLQWEDRLPLLASWSHLRHLLREQAIDLIIDVGANVGQFGSTVRRLGYTGDIVSFEPLSAARAALESAAAGDPRWVVRPEAIGRQRSRGILQTYANSSFSSFNTLNGLGRERFGAQVEAVGQEAVDIVPLDSLLGDIATRGSRRIFLKTDTQGYDLEVLAGAIETLREASAVLSEASTTPIYEDATLLPDLVRNLEREGFSLSNVFPIGHDKPPSLALLELDCYFVRTDPAKSKRAVGGPL
jgi:FkbM family methyltransferase